MKRTDMSRYERYREITWKGQLGLKEASLVQRFRGSDKHQLPKDGSCGLPPSLSAHIAGKIKRGSELVKKEKRKGEGMGRSGRSVPFEDVRVVDKSNRDPVGWISRQLRQLPPKQLSCVTIRRCRHSSFFVRNLCAYHSLAHRYPKNKKA